jgi:HK97 family phage prohead protease
MSRFVTHQQLEDAIAAAARGIALGLRECETHAAQPKIQRARLQLAQIEKFLSNGTRTIRGIASTGSIDRVGDIVEPLGGTWALPLPLLWQHDHAKPIGAVREAKAAREGISIVAEIVEGVQAADDAWRLIEGGALDSFSIGFIGRKGEPIATGTRWTAWELLEISVVSVPANVDAKITSTRAAKLNGPVKLIQPVRPGVKLIGGTP